MPEREYQLNVLVNGKKIKRTWVGKNGLDACKRYQEMYPDHVIIAWREMPFGLQIGIDARQIID